MRASVLSGVPRFGASERRNQCIEYPVGSEGESCSEIVTVSTLSRPDDGFLFWSSYGKIGKSLTILPCSLSQSQTFPCASAKQFCCGQACQRILKCQNHLCHRPCHLVSGVANEKMVNEFACDRLVGKCVHSRREPNACAAKKRVRKTDRWAVNIRVRWSVILATARRANSDCACDAIAIRK